MRIIFINGDETRFSFYMIEYLASGVTHTQGRILAISYRQMEIRLKLTDLLAGRTKTPQKHNFCVKYSVERAGGRFGETSHQVRRTHDCESLTPQ